MSFNPDSIFTAAAQKGASDVHLQVGSPVVFRIHKALHHMSNDAVTPELMAEICQSIMGKDYDRFVQDRELDCSYTTASGLRLRINGHFSLGKPGLVARLINQQVPSLHDLRMDFIEGDLPYLSDGLLLFTGPTGAGKSTAMSAVIEAIRGLKPVHILTLEDPIEYEFPPQDTGLIRQRQFGEDFHSFPEAMRRILRQDPDIVMVGEMRDLETISAALTLAETGHLVIATLHTPSALQTIDRIIDVFPPHQQPQIRSQLSLSLKMIVAQRLIPKIGGGLVALREVLKNTVAVANTIREGRVQELVSVMQMSGEQGMVTFNQAAEELFAEGLIDKETYAESLGVIKALQNK